MSRDQAKRMAQRLGLMLAPVALPALAQAQALNRANFNIMNSDSVSITASNAPGATAQITSALIANLFGDGGWGNSAAGVSGDTALIINFNAIRNIKTIQIYTTRFAGYGIDDATIQTSNDGVTWSAPLAHTASGGGAGSQTTLVLNNAAGAQYLRIEGTSYAQASHRWLIDSLRIYGDVGTLPPDWHLDLVSGTAFPGGVTMSLSGISITDTTTSQFVDDALNPAKRQVLYNITTNSSFTLHFGSTVDFERFGFMSDGSFTDPNMRFKVETSTNGVDWTTVLIQNGGIAPYQNFFTLSLDTQGTYLRWTDLASNNTLQPRINDIFVFIPEATTVALLSMGAILFCAVRRRT